MDWSFRMQYSMEVGRSFWCSALGLSVIQEIKLFFTYEKLLCLNFYEFVADQYATLQWDHN
jgi:hypothetical protein